MGNSQPPGSTQRGGGVIACLPAQLVGNRCSCNTCADVVARSWRRRAYLHTVAGKSLTSAAILLTIHNVAYMQRLTKRIRQAITEQRFPEFVREYVRMQYPKGDHPEWVRLSLDMAGISM